MPTERLSIRFLLTAITLALGVWVAANWALFIYFYGDTLTPLALPYLERFEASERVDYRRVAGQWRLQDQRLVQTDLSLADVFAVIPIDLAAYPSYQFGAHIQIEEGPKGAGLLFNMQTFGLVDRSHLVRLGEYEGRPYLVFGYFDPAGQFVQQGTLTPPDLSPGVDLAVIVYGDAYAVLVNGQLQQRDIPLQYHGGQVALTTWFSRVAFDDIQISLPTQALDTLIAAAPVAAAATQPVTTTAATISQTGGETATNSVPAAPVANAVPVANSDSALIFVQDFAGPVDQSQWSPLSGDWRFEPTALVQSQPDGFDYSTIYSGTFAQFTARVELRHTAGLPGGGLLFNLPERTRKALGHMVRYYEGRALVWGYFDEQSNFVGQGDKAVAPPGDQPHTLRIVVGTTDYAIFLDEELIAEQIPLISSSGHLGLTASQSVVAFTRLEVTTAGLEQ